MSNNKPESPAVQTVLDKIAQLDRFSEILDKQEEVQRMGIEPNHALEAAAQSRVLDRVRAHRLGGPTDGGKYPWKK